MCLQSPRSSIDELPYDLCALVMRVLDPHIISMPRLSFSKCEHYLHNQILLFRHDSLLDFSAWVRFSKVLKKDFAVLHAFWYSVPSFSAKFWNAFLTQLTLRLSVLLSSKSMQTLQRVHLIVICYKHTSFGTRITDLIFFFLCSPLSIFLVATLRWTSERNDFCNMLTFPEDTVFRSSTIIAKSITCLYTLHSFFNSVHCSVDSLISWLKLVFAIAFLKICTKTSFSFEIVIDRWNTNLVTINIKLTKENNFQSFPQNLNWAAEVYVSFLSSLNMINVLSYTWNSHRGAFSAMYIAVLHLWPNP